MPGGKNYFTGKRGLWPFGMGRFLVITVIFHLCCFATVLADSSKSFVQDEAEIGSDMTWKEKVIEVLEEFLGEKSRLLLVQ